MHLRRSWFILTLVAALLSACGAPSAQTPTAPAEITAEPTAAPSPTVEPTAAPSPTVEPTAAATPPPQATVSHQFVAREFTRQDEPTYEFLTYHPDGHVDFENGDPAEVRAILDQWFIGSVWQLYDDGTFTFSPPDGAPGREVFGELKGTYTPGSYFPNSFDIQLSKSVAGSQGTEILIRGTIEPMVRPGIDYPFAKLYVTISYPLPDGRVARIHASINYLRIEEPETPVEVVPAPPAPVQATAAPGSADVDLEHAIKIRIVSIKAPGTTAADPSLPGVEDATGALVKEWFVGATWGILLAGATSNALVIQPSKDATGGESFGLLKVPMSADNKYVFTIEQSAEGFTDARIALSGTLDVFTNEIELDGVMIVPDGSGGLRKAALAKTVLTFEFVQ